MKLKGLFYLIFMLILFNLLFSIFCMNCKASETKTIGIVKENIIPSKEVQIFVNNYKVLTLVSFDNESFERIKKEADIVSSAINQYFGSSKGSYDPSDIRFVTEDKYFCCYVGDDLAFKIDRSQAFLQSLADSDITNMWLTNLQRSLGYNPDENHKILYGHKYYSKEFIQEGIASWYGTNLAGRYMSNGEIFDPYDLTAAHRWLPLGSIVLVTNENNGKSVIVTITDRMGSTSRVIDLSEGAAEKIGMISSGLAPVKIELLK
ncbi:septal ring lytic transglycosylase RlpA family protein [Thermodesulfobium narugense]|nr:septal ring lytic transglycosylase RlpA family protein [Thermodesulfobium narugense]